MDRRDFLETLLTGPAVPALSGLSLAGGPQESIAFAGGDTPRERRNFNARWLFARQTKGTGELGSFDRTNGEAAQVESRFREAHRFEYDDGGWQAVELPHTWNAHDVTDATPGYWRGIGWYRKHFGLDPAQSQKRAFLEFEGVNSVSEFWLNGERIGEHRGGYTSFEFDVTDQIHFDAAGNVLAVKVDNLYHATVPPTVKTDYNFYGGIYRDVWLRFSEPTYVDRVVWTTPAVSVESAELSLKAYITNKTSEAHNLTFTHDIFDPEGQLALSLSTSVHLLARTTDKTESHEVVKRPRLWSPNSPSIYRIRTTLRSEGVVADRVETPLGFRWFKFDPQRGFVLNGERVQIQGTNWHQCYPGMGSALPNSRHRKDMEMIREMGVNFWRTSHYPHDPAAIDASDRLGLIVWEELPVNKEIGNPDEYITNVLAMAEEMIRRDRNHPSVVVWGIAGEISAPPAVAKRVVESVARKYRELDPTRPVAMHAPGSDEIEALVDVVGLGADEETDEKHHHHPQRSYMTAEYAVATIGRGIYGMGPDSEDLGCEKHEAYLRELYARGWMAGGVIWHQFDYDGETYDTVIPHVVAFGMADVWRIPKDVYYFYQSQWSATPMVHIVGHWTWPGHGGQSKRVKVYSNRDEVELVLNGRSLGAKNRSAGAGMPNPPRVWDVIYAPGTLTAIARGRGRELRDERRTAGVPHHLLLESDAPELSSGDRESIAYLTAIVVDEQGTVVPTATHPITFTSYGPGELLEQTWLGYGTGLTWNTVAGKTRVAFRATSRTGRAVVTAYSPGIAIGRAELNVSAPGQPDEMEYRDRFEPYDA